MSIFSKNFRDRKRDLPDILCNTEEDFSDLTFKIVDQTKQSDGTWHFNTRARYNGNIVGFQLVLGSQWVEGRIDLNDGEKLPTYGGIVDYRSNGEESNPLAIAIGALYGVECSGQMKPQTRFTAISLAGNPAKLETEALKIKLFYESEIDNEYAEVFTNIAFESRIIEIREKDPEYRLALARAITIEV